MADVQQVVIFAIRLGSRLFGGNAVFFRIGQKVGPAFKSIQKFFVLPGCNHLDSGIQSIIRQFKTHLIITFTCGAVSHIFSTDISGNFNLFFGNQGPGNGCSEKVAAFIYGIGLEHGKNIIRNKFFSHIHNEYLACTYFHGLFFGSIKIFLLSYIGHISIYFISLLQKPF